MHPEQICALMLWNDGVFPGGSQLLKPLLCFCLLHESFVMRQCCFAHFRGTQFLRISKLSALLKVWQLPEVTLHKHEDAPTVNTLKISGQGKKSFVRSLEKSGTHFINLVFFSTFQFCAAVLIFSMPLYPIIQFLRPVRKRRIKILNMVVSTVLPTLAQEYCYEIKEDTKSQS